MVLPLGTATALEIVNAIPFFKKRRCTSDDIFSSGDWPSVSTFVFGEHGLGAVHGSTDLDVGSAIY